ncbi:MAG: hypothetical protein NC218_07120 [Acetobacter sp.]|nr:hypothetical protein [Acetobacter sp.]
METKTKKIRSALYRASSVLFVLMLLIGTMLGTSCSEQLSNVSTPITDTITIIKDLYWTSERTGIATVTVKDTLVKSEVTFKQTSRLYNQKEEINLTFNPTAYLNIRLTKSRIDVLTKDELPATLTKQYIQSRTPYKNKTDFGEDVIAIYEFSNGQKATVSYGYRCMGVIVGNDTLTVPHVEVDNVSFIRQTYENFGQKTEIEDPYKAILVFNAQYTIKGTSKSDVTANVEMKPWYHKVVTSEATKVEDVSYSGKFLNCPVDAYELIEKVKTNKGEFSNTYRVNLALEVKKPNEREQPSLDSLFNEVSKGNFSEKLFSETKNKDGFTVRTMTGTYTSTNTGKQARTAVESSVNFTYQYPVKFESEYGTYNIDPLKLSFEEIEFEVEKISETKEAKLFQSVNTVEATIGTCTLNLIEEVVNLRIQKEKEPNVVKVDSTYTLKGSGDDYIVDKTIIWSDGSKTTTTYDYKGRHNATATPFGNKVTTSLNWNENPLQRVSQSKESEEKKFSDVTKFTAVYTTSNWRSDANNGTESGSFSFTETSPVVTFIDGAITKTFPERKYTLTGMGADVASNFTTMVVNGKNYKAYAYDYITKAEWNGTTEPNLVSNGFLLMPADVTGEPVYTPSQSWNGNTTTVKVTKTTPHTEAEDEVQTFTKNFTIGLSGLTNGKIYADNTNFSAAETHTENSSTANDNPWTVVTYKRNYAYKLSNGAATRDDLKAEVTDAEITFNDGTFRHTFNVRLNVTKNENFGNARKESDYTVTPHTLTVTGTTIDGKTVSSKGTTDIYVKEPSTEPEPPHLGKPKSFTVTATFDPTSKVTRRAFVFNWEDGVTYAVCDYETMLPASGDFMFKKDSYNGYNSVGYDKNNPTQHWQPARGSDDSDAIRWHFANGTVMSAIDKALSCKVIGWKNIVDGDYALIIRGYTYEINGYNLTVKAPNGETVTFNSHYNP